MNEKGGEGEIKEGRWKKWEEKVTQQCRKMVVFSLD